jgi:hypothetical protein
MSDDLSVIWVREQCLGTPPSGIGSERLSRACLERNTVDLFLTCPSNHDLERYVSASLVAESRVTNFALWKHLVFYYPAIDVAFCSRPIDIYTGTITTVCIFSTGQPGE